MLIAQNAAKVFSIAVGMVRPPVRAAQRHLPIAQPAAQTPTWTLPGFLGQSRIMTAFGALPIEALRVNDPIRTVSGRILYVRRIQRVELGDGFLGRHPEAQPLRIASDAFAPGLPEQDVFLSPGQELSVAFGKSAAQSVRAGDIKGNAAVASAPQDALVYYSIELREAAHVYIEGMAVLIPATPSVQTDDEDYEEDYDA